MTKILVIDNNTTTLQTIKLSLENKDYGVFIADNGQSGLKIAWEEAPDLVILELLLPIMDGFEVCRRLRELGVPLILVTSRKHDERSVVRALEMGADDYLRQPVELPILLVKIRTLLRRIDQKTKKNKVYHDGNLLIDLEKRYVEIQGEPIKLTPTEFRVLSILLRRAGRVVTHEELIREVWGTDKEDSLGSLKLYIHYLRQKIEERPRKPQYLLAEWGVGYRFKNEKAESAQAA